MNELFPVIVINGILIGIPFYIIPMGRKIQSCLKSDYFKNPDQRSLPINKMFWYYLFRELRLWFFLWGLSLAVFTVFLSLSDYSNSYAVTWPIHIISSIFHIMCPISSMILYIAVCIFWTQYITHRALFLFLSFSTTVLIQIIFVFVLYYALPENFVDIATGYIDFPTDTQTHFVPLWGVYGSFFSFFLIYAMLRKVVKNT